MGRIAGVFYFDRRPIAPQDEAWVRTALASPNPLQIRVQRAAGLVMGSVNFGSHPKGEPEPADDAAAWGSSICTWEGRLHNREDLLGGLQHPPPLPLTDGGVALTIYETGGIDRLRDLIGDWSLAIWDAGRRAVLLASDYAGIRPLYYYRDSQCIQWSTSLEHLARRAGNYGLDDEYVASYLRRGNCAYRTPHRGIFPVPPGQAVFATRDRFFTQPFWSLPFRGEVRFQDPRSYEEGLIALFQEAVSVRLAGDSTVCAELSGGLDSSSVVSMASRIFSMQQAPAKLVTFSYQSADSTDKKYIRAVERATGFPGIHLDLQDYPFVTAEQPGGAAPEGWTIRFDELARRMASIGSQVLLTGQLGDFLMGGLIDDAEQVVEHLQQGRPIQAMREALAWSRYLRVPIYSILWRALRTNFSTWSAAMDPTELRGVHNPHADDDSIAPEFRRLVSLEEIEQLRRSRWQDASPGHRRRFRILSDTLESRSLQTPEPLQHLSFSHPFAHRRLVEYMLTIPSGEVCRPGEPRRLMRRAFSGILPPAIAARKSKATYTAVYRKSLIPLAAELLKRPASIRLVELGYLDGQSLAGRLERMVEGLQCNESQLRHVILLEFWLRKWERGARSAGSAEIEPPAGALTSVEPLPRS